MVLIIGRVATRPRPRTAATEQAGWLQFTRPAEYRGLKVPEVLLSGNHAQIEKMAPPTWPKDMVFAVGVNSDMNGSSSSRKSR
jgi:hypothetical protein